MQQSTSLKKVISSVISVDPETPAVNYLVHTCSRMALAYLLQKVRRGSLQPERFGLSLDDLAMDCCAELFQRNDSGRFVQLVAYFDQTGWEDKTEEELQISLRRVVFSKVNENLFRRYREVDPNLSKIIRNLKAAADRSAAENGISLHRQGPDLWLICDGDNTSRQTLPLVPMEVLEGYLTAGLKGPVQMEQVLEIFSTFVREHPYYSNRYPLGGIAQLVRSALIRLNVPADDSPEIPDSFFHEEVEKAIETAANETKGRLRQSYVKKGKVDAPTFELYFRTINDILALQFVDGTSTECSYYDVLASRWPSLDMEAYRVEHRNRLEYLVKLTRTCLLDHLRQRVV